MDYASFFFIQNWIAYSPSEVIQTHLIRNRFFVEHIRITWNFLRKKEHAVPSLLTLTVHVWNKLKRKEENANNFIYTLHAMISTNIAKSECAHALIHIAILYEVSQLEF